MRTAMLAFALFLASVAAACVDNSAKSSTSCCGTAQGVTSCTYAGTAWYFVNINIPGATASPTVIAALQGPTATIIANTIASISSGFSSFYSAATATSNIAASFSGSTINAGLLLSATQATEITTLGLTSDTVVMALGNSLRNFINTPAFTVLPLDAQSALRSLSTNTLVTISIPTFTNVATGQTNIAFSPTANSFAVASAASSSVCTTNTGNNPLCCGPSCSR